MGLTASIVILAFLAFIGWLTIRIINRREKWTKRTAAVLCIVLAYPLSFGPACWITSRLNVGADRIPVIYWPMALLIKDGPVDLYMPVALFSTFGAHPRWGWNRYIAKDEICWERLPAALFPAPPPAAAPVNPRIPTPDGNLE